MISQNLPPLPQVPNGGRGPLNVDVRFQAPATQMARLGEVPQDWYEGASNGSPGMRDIVVEQPLMAADGSVRMQTQSIHLEASTTSPQTSALVSGIVAGIAGVVVGSLVGGLGSTLIGGLAAGGVGAYLGFRSADRKRIGLEWQEQPIVESRMVGVTENIDEVTDVDRVNGIPVGSGTTVQHRYEPQLETRQVGTYYIPVMTNHRK